jgi:hypothetical protein
LQILESQLEQKVIKYAEEMGYLTFKVSPISSRGWPDRVFINYSGLHIYIELKKSGKKIRKLQAYRISQLQERDVLVLWTDNYDKACRFLDEHILEPT